MKKLLVSLSFVLGLFLAGVRIVEAQTPTSWSVSSPNGQLTAIITHTILGTPYPASQRLYYQIQRSGQVVIEESPLGLTLTGTGGDYVNNLEFVSEQRSTLSETYTVKSGKRSTIINQASELTLAFRNSGGKTVELGLRVYNDGVAYRYRFPDSGTYAVSAEISGYRIPQGSSGWAQPWQVNYEQEYLQVNLLELTQVGKEWGHPLLLKLPSNQWALISEAAVDGNYAALHFRGSGNRLVSLVFPPDQSGTITGLLPLKTPWRVIVVGETLTTLVESDIFKNLNPPSQVADLSWINPGRVAWSWWSDPNSPQSVATQKQYVDFAAEMGWEYVLIDAGWQESWVPEIVDYARQRGVDIILWFFWGDFTQWTPNGWNVSETAARSQFTRVQAWGVKGVKIDFMDSDNQERMKFYELINRLSAEYRMVVNYHGASKPSGEERSWPQALTREAVRGAEYKTPGALHNTTLPYTRNLLGPMDYTPVTFSLPGDTTVVHQLALAVVFESGLQHFADSAASYRASPAKEFLQAVPVTWDETKFITGAPGELAVMARRKGTEWYLGIVGTQAQTLPVPLTFLDSTASYQATIYKDGTASTEMVVETRNVRASDTLTVILRTNGGAAVRFSPIGTATPSPTPIIVLGNGDVTGDGQVTVADMVGVLTSWFMSATGVGGPNQYGDTIVNAMDWAVVIRNMPAPTATPPLPTPTATLTTGTPTPTPSPAGPTPTPPPPVSGEWTL